MVIFLQAMTQRRPTLERFFAYVPQRNLRMGDLQRRIALLENFFHNLYESSGEDDEQIEIPGNQTKAQPSGCC